MIFCSSSASLGILAAQRSQITNIASLSSVLK